MQRTIKIIAAGAVPARLPGQNVLEIPNDADARTVDFTGADVIELNFPKFTDGRAYSQAVLLRRRGFTGEIRATGDVLVDQLVAMQRTGFTSAVLREDKDPADAERQFERYPRYYQGDLETAPLFKATA
jgi:uncharacterized protein (DUF934 family)